MSKKLDTQISSELRRLWMKSEPRKAALIRSRVPCEDGSRKKFLETCERCGKTAYIGEKEHKIKKNGEPSKVMRPVLVVHHVKEVPNVWEADFMERLFCHEDDLMILCNFCHDEVHDELRENK